jgi:predicted transcriptional regulator
MTVSQVKHVMRETLNTINADATVLDATKIMGTGSYVIILEKGMPIGIVTERDVIDQVVVPDREPKSVTVTEIMSTPVITIDPDEDLVTASNMMRDHNITKLLVMRENIVYGIITDMVISRHFQSYVDRAVRDMIRWTPAPI